MLIHSTALNEGVNNRFGRNQVHRTWAFLPTILQYEVNHDRNVKLQIIQQFILSCRDFSLSRDNLCACTDLFLKSYGLCKPPNQTQKSDTFQYYSLEQLERDAYRSKFINSKVITQKNRMKAEHYSALSSVYRDIRLQTYMFLNSQVLSMTFLPIFLTCCQPPSQTIWHSSFRVFLLM